MVIINFFFVLDTKVFHETADKHIKKMKVKLKVRERRSLRCVYKLIHKYNSFISPRK